VSVPRRAGLPDGVRVTTLDAAGGPLAAIVAEPFGGRPGSGSLPALPTVLCVPGYTGSKEDFTPLLPLLAAAGHRVIAYDQRGQYQSTGPDVDAAYRRDALARDLANLLTDLGPAHVVAHSYGGIVARAAVLDHGLRPVSLTLLGSGPDAIQGNRRVLVEAMRPILEAGGVAAVWEAAEALNANDPRRQGMPADVEAFLRERFLAGSGRALRVMGEDLMAEPDRVAELADRVAAGLAVLVAHGAGDDAWPPATQREMARRLGAAYVVIPDALHSPAVEAPEATAAALLEFWQARRD
jgi:pimeloyl-ACP methyl ester carboxylesterase